MADESHIVANCHECVLGVRGQTRGRATLEKEKEYSEGNAIFYGAVVGVYVETL
jgi:hypothetical protein